MEVGYPRIRIGTDVLVEVTMFPQGDHHLSSVDWGCEFYTDGAYKLSISKDKAFKLDNDRYLCPVPTHNFNPGLLKGDLRARIPNQYFEGGVKNEIVEIKLEKIYLGYELYRGCW